jgi:cytosine/adenosine deaminase-related metal-dependent hydrolase
MESIILSAETILPVSSAPFTNGAVLVKDGKIREVGKADEIKKRHGSVHELDLGKGILLPGFINGHVHLELGWIKRKIEAFDGFTGWLEQIVTLKRDGVSEEELVHSVESGVSSLIQSGVTTVGEISSYGGIDKPILKDSGLRTVLFREVVDSNEESTDFSTLEKGALFEERLFAHAPYSCSPELLQKILESHGENGVPVGMHLAESPDEVGFVRSEENGIEKKIFPLIGKSPFKRPSADSPIAYARNIGLFDNTKITAIHMVQVSESEAEEIRGREVGIMLCPRSNMFLQVGSPPVEYYADNERLGLGTDGFSSNYNLDYFEELRFLHLLMSQTLGRSAAYKSVYAATLGGAGALFIEDRVGSIEPGKQADLIFINTENESADPYLSVISSDEHNLGLVMVGGSILYSRLGSPATK